MAKLNLLDSPRMINKILKSFSSKKYGEYNGCDQIYQKVADMVKVITDRQPTKLLHVHPNTAFLTYLEENTNIAVTGYIDEDISEEQKGWLRYYQEIFISLNQTESPFSQDSFQFVVNCVPPEHNKYLIGIEESIELVNYTGYLLFGGNDQLYSQKSILQSFEYFKAEKGIELLSLQKLVLPKHTSKFSELGLHDSMSYNIGLARKLI